MGSFGRNLRNRARSEHSSAVHARVTEANANTGPYALNLTMQMERDTPEHIPVEINVEFKGRLVGHGDPTDTTRREEYFCMQISAKGASADALRAFEIKLEGKGPEGRICRTTSNGIETLEVHGSSTSIIADINTALDADLKLARPTQIRNEQEIGGRG